MARSRVKSRKRISPQTFDPEDFDIHAAEKSIRSKIMPLKRGEKLARVSLADKSPRKSSDPENRSKSFLVAVFGNILIPGLGNVYLRRNPFSISILVLSLLVILLTFSPVFPIVQLLNYTHTPTPSTVEQTTLTLYVPGNIQLDNSTTLAGPTFSFLLVPLLLTWIYFIYLLLHHDQSIAWRL